MDTRTQRGNAEELLASWDTSIVGEHNTSVGLTAIAHAILALDDTARAGAAALERIAAAMEKATNAKLDTHIHHIVRADHTGAPVYPQDAKPDPTTGYPPTRAQWMEAKKLIADAEDALVAVDWDVDASLGKCIRRMYAELIRDRTTPPCTQAQWEAAEACVKELRQAHVSQRRPGLYAGALLHAFDAAMKGEAHD